MFQGFHPEQWPGLPGTAVGGRPGAKGRGRATESVAGESVANSDYTDVSKGGGASLGLGLDTIGSARPASISQSDRLFNNYVESSGRNGYHRRIDDDEKSVSTAFASQMGFD